jgi:long-chain fatty acid transport protein
MIRCSHIRFPAPAVVLCLFAISFTPAAWPGALRIAESGGSDIAMAGAGRAALATDATTLAANPAGMSRLEGNHLAIALLPARLDLEFDPDDPALRTATNRDGTTLLGSAYFVHTAERFSWGLGVYSDLGLSFDFDRDWAGRRLIEDASLQSLNLTPAVSWRLTDTVDVGFSLNAQFARADVALAVNNDAAIYGPPAGLPDGRLRLEGDSWDVGASLGVLYRPDDATRLGLAWTSATDHRFDLDVTATELHPVPAAMLTAMGEPGIAMDFPQQLLAGGVRQVTSATSVAAGIAWQDWSTPGAARLRTGAPGVSRTKIFPHGLDDTWHASLGVRHQLSGDWRIAAGIAYDSDPSDDHPVPIYFPMTAQWRTAVGVEYQPRPGLVMRCAYLLLKQDAIRVDPQYHPLPLPGAGAMPGQFEPSRLHVLAVSIERAW